MNKRNNIYVDIHVLQTVPPSCVNRDDTGSPKTCIYGGVRRARVSSQAWKHAVRLAFREMYEPENLGMRTKRILAMLENSIEKLDGTANARKLAERVVSAIGLKVKEDTKSKEVLSDVLFFMSEAQANALAQLALQSTGAKDEEKSFAAACKAAIKDNPSPDMALFGRMVASDPSLNYDAAAMVAHGISTHKVQTEFDYFTAVDDLSPEDNVGAGHLGTVEFNSSTLYRYASVNVKELAKNLGSQTGEAVRNFVEAFLLSMPTGKINTFANRTLPGAIYITVRNDQPVSLVPAFEKPVLPDEDGGYVANSKSALVAYAESVYKDFVSEPVKVWVVGDGLEKLGERTKLQLMLEEIEKFLDDSISEAK